MVLDGELHVEDTQGLAEDRVPPDGTNTRVAEGLYVEGVDDEEVQLDEGHLGADGGGEERNDEDLEALLDVIGEDGQDRSWVLGGVVLAVDEPESVKLVCGSVVQVEPVVESHLPPCHLERCGP